MQFILLKAISSSHWGFLKSLLVFSLFYCASAHAEAQKTVAIITYNVLGAHPWDPDSIQSGITGSEEAVIYMSQQLAKLNYQVIVLGDPPLGSLHSLPEANPRFVKTDFKESQPFDIAISWRMPDAASRLRQIARQVYMWPHDTCHFSLGAAEIEGFDDVFWSSEWQRQQWISINEGFKNFTTIYGNGINPDQFESVKEKENPYSCIYGSNYARGLEILLNIWPAVRERFPKATLDIYYGWQHWGLLSLEKETRMRAQVAELANQGVREHGLVSHKKLNEAYEKASFWTYPCIGLETFCITALRAQLSGNIPVIIKGSALGETVRCGYSCIEPEQYLNTLTQAMGNVDQVTLADRQNMGNFVLKEYTWEAIARKWKATFDSQTRKMSHKSDDSEY